MASKAKNQKNHTKRRAFQRFGIELNDCDVEEIVEDIQNKRGVFLERKSNRVTLWKISVQGTPCVAVYDNKRKSIATVLTIEMWEQNQNLLGLNGQAGTELESEKQKALSGLNDQLGNVEQVKLNRQRLIHKANNRYCGFFKKHAKNLLDEETYEAIKTAALKEIQIEIAHLEHDFYLEDL